MRSTTTYVFTCAHDIFEFGLCSQGRTAVDAPQQLSADFVLVHDAADVGAYAEKGFASTQWQKELRVGIVLFGSIVTSLCHSLWSCPIMSVGTHGTSSLSEEVVPWRDLRTGCQPATFYEHLSRQRQSAIFWTRAARRQIYMDAQRHGLKEFYTSHSFLVQDQIRDRCQYFDCRTLLPSCV